MEERPEPKAGDRDIVVKVMACGLCGSDLMEWYRIKRAPLVLGHEPAGIVVEAGKLVTNVKIGDRVFVTHHVPCNACYHCRTGHETACTTFQSAPTTSSQAVFHSCCALPARALRPAPSCSPIS